MSLKAMLSPGQARMIIENVGNSGTPPEWGVQFFTVGLDPYLKIIQEEYLKTFIKEEGGASFKMVIGAYGGGKTHFLYNIRDLAWKQNFMVSYSSLSPQETPFHKLHLVYQSIARNLTYPMNSDPLVRDYEKGIGTFIKAWFSNLTDSLRSEHPDADPEAFEKLLRKALDTSLQGLENINFINALRYAVLALADNREETFSSILQWLLVEGYDRETHRRLGILHEIDRSNAFSMIRSLIQWIRAIGYSGLIILFDEAEQLPSLGTRQKDLMLSNLREIIDACGHISFRHVMIFYSVPTENFFEGRSNIYEALKQRIATVFDFLNPSGVRIRLENLDLNPVEALVQIGVKLSSIYQAAYKTTLEEKKLVPAISLLAQKAYEMRFGDIGYKRLFVQGAIRTFHGMRLNPSFAVDETTAGKIVSGAEL